MPSALLAIAALLLTPAHAIAAASPEKPAWTGWTLELSHYRMNKGLAVLVETTKIHPLVAVQPSGLADLQLAAKPASVDAGVWTAFRNQLDLSRDFSRPLFADQLAAFPAKCMPSLVLSVIVLEDA